MEINVKIVVEYKCEKEHKTLDALMISPLNLHEIIIGKSTTILLFSLISQLLVYLINVGLTFDIFTVIPVMLVGGILFIQVGMLIGLLMNSSQTASAVASIVMVTLFIIGTIYQALPDWESVLQFIPSVVIAEIILAIFKKQFLTFEIALLLLWVIVLSTSVFYLAVKEQTK
jgi:ABC-2 type transport system permease protein